ncbi:MAG: chitin binding domain-containing protein [Alphaproteobacteria bacterium]|nr:chitin binding domain-containing protein [Alphaproteobacteria bacterium]
MQKFIPFIFILSIFFSIPATYANTCPAFDAATGNTATSPNPLALTWVAGMVCNVPATQTFTDELGTYTFDSTCYMNCATNQVMSDSVCFANTGAPGFRTTGIGTPPTGAAAPTCPVYEAQPGHSIFFSYNNSCEWAFSCANGSASNNQCPANMHWNRVTGRCSSPETAKCPIPFTRACTPPSGSNATAGTQTCFQGTTAAHCGPCIVTACASGYVIPVIGRSFACAPCPVGMGGQQLLSTTGQCFDADYSYIKAKPCGPANSVGVQACNQAGTICAAECVWNCKPGYRRSGDSCTLGTGTWVQPCMRWLEWTITHNTNILRSGSIPSNATSNQTCTSAGCGDCTIITCNAGFFRDGDQCIQRETWKVDCATPPNTGGVQACNFNGTRCSECRGEVCGGDTVESTTGVCFVPTQNQACVPAFPENAAGTRRCNSNGTLCTACEFTGCQSGFNLENGECIEPCPAGASTLNCPPDWEYMITEPHPNNCKFFYYCYDGAPVCQGCPSGMHWSADLETCTWPANAGCCNALSNPNCTVPGS